MVMEFMQLGNLLQYLRDDSHSLEYYQIMDMAGSIASGMDYLRKQKIVHCNFSAQHILVTKISGKIVYKISNFRLARIVHGDFYNEAEFSVDQFAIKWLAREAAIHNHFTIMSDVWSFGILLYEVATYDDVPYPGMSDAQVLHTYNMATIWDAQLMHIISWSSAGIIMLQIVQIFVHYTWHFVCLDLHY